MRRSILLTSTILGMIVAPQVASANSISPSVWSGTTKVGGVLTLDKLVSVTAGAPTSPQADVFFLTDSTGSMGGTIDSVKSNFGTIAGSLTGNFAFGVGNYKDEGDPWIYQLNQPVTTSQADVQTALNALYADGGGDFPEQSLYALKQVATDPGTNFRAGSKRIVLIAGDAPSHTDLTTVADAAAALNSAAITLESIDVGSLNYYGQYSGVGSLYDIGVSGKYFVNPDSSTLVDTIQAAIGSAFANYTTVTLQVVGASGVSVSFTAPYDGIYDRSIDRDFDFGLTFTGLTVGEHKFQVNALVDGGVIATEWDTITVTNVPEPATWVMMLAGLTGLGLVAGHRRKGRLAEAFA